MLIAIGVLVALVLAAGLWWLLRDPHRGDSTFRTERKWAWELTLDEDQERAFMDGLAAYDDEVGGVHPRRREGVLHVHSGMLISLFALTEQFAALGPDATRKPEDAVRDLIERARQGETGGVLHITDAWMGDAAQVDGMDREDFAAAMTRAVFAHGVEYAYAGVDSDAESGYTTVGVLREEPPHVRKIRDDAFDHVIEQRRRDDPAGEVSTVVADDEPGMWEAEDRADAELSRYVNTLMICHRRVLAHYREARPRMPQAEPGDVLSVVLARMLGEGLPGVTWTRQPTRDQHALAMELLGSR